MRFCNRYVADGAFLGATEIAMGGDAARAAMLVERFDRSQLKVERVRTTFEVHDGLRFAKLRGASAPRRVRPGQRIRIRIRTQRKRSPVRRHSFTMRVPRSLKPGIRTLRLKGTGPDPTDASLEAIFSAGFGDEEFGFGFGGGGGGSPATVEKLATRVSQIHRYDGIRGTFRKRRTPKNFNDLIIFFGPFGAGGSSTAADGRPVFRHPRLRIGGKRKLEFRVLPRKERRGKR